MSHLIIFNSALLINTIVPKWQMKASVKALFITAAFKAMNASGKEVANYCHEASNPHNDHTVRVVN